MIGNNLPSVKTGLFYMISKESLGSLKVLTLLRNPIDDSQRDSQGRGTASDTFVSDSRLGSSMIGCPQIQYEYRLSFELIEPEDCPEQTWLYRYDCIVNMAYPQIALQRNADTNELNARHFSGDIS